MSKDKEIQFHASSTGRSYIDEKEFFKTEKVKKIVDKLLGSSLYKDIKKIESQSSTN